MATTFKDNVMYGFFIYDMKPGTYRKNPAIKFTFASVETSLDVWEVMSLKNPITGTRIHKLMQVLGYKDVEGKEPDPITFFKRGMHFSAKVFTTYSEGKTETPRFRINFESIKPYTKSTGMVNEELTKWVKGFVGELRRKDALVTKLRNSPQLPSFEQLGTLCNMVLSGELDLQ